MPGTAPPTLGVIGGMGPLATAAFLRVLALETLAKRDQDHLRVLVDSDPSIPDRTTFLMGRGEDPRPALARVAQRLEAAGATLLVMPCNTANLLADSIAGAVTVSVLPWIDIGAEAAARAGGTTGLLATDGTVVAGVYQRAIERFGSSTMVPLPADQRIVMDAIYGPTGVKATGTVTRDIQGDLWRVVDELVQRGADNILLACTELPLAIPANDPRWPVVAIDPARAVARAAIRLAGGKTRTHAS